MKLESTINRTNDIEGAQPELRHLRYCNQRPNLYHTGDIGKAQPSTLHRDTNSQDYTLHLDDIEGAHPKPYTFKTQRLVDPMNPEYKLPTTQLAAHPQPKFVRDAYSIGDIEGTAPRPRFRFAERENHEVHDIEGAQSGWRPRHERVRREGDPRDGLDVRDINDVGFKTQRVSDPLRPQHFVNGMAIADDMVATMPKSLPKKKDGPTYSLTTQDIEGAQCGWKPPHEMQPPIEMRRHFRNTNFVGDIAGAQPDTVTHAIRTNRVSNPLNPVYRSLDGDVLAAPTTPMYGEPTGHGGGGSAPGLGAATMYAAPGEDYRPMTNQSEKDAMIAQLEMEVERLRTTSVRSADPTRTMSGRERTATGTGAPRTATADRLLSATAKGDISATQLVARPPTNAGGGFVAPRPPTNAGASGYMMKASGGSASGRAATGERLVLRSSDGQPRVTMTPSERRQARVVTDDIASVRDL